MCIVYVSMCVLCVWFEVVDELSVNVDEFGLTNEVLTNYVVDELSVDELTLTS